MNEILAKIKELEECLCSCTDEESIEIGSTLNDLYKQLDMMR